MLVFAGLSPHPPLIVPEVGGPDLEKAQETVEGMRAWAAAAAAAQPETVVFISPHGSFFRGVVGYLGSRELTGNMAAFGAPQVAFQVDNDLELGREIGVAAEQAGIEVIEVVRGSHDPSQVKGLDHGVLVPLYYLKQAGVQASVVAFGISLLPTDKLYQFGCAMGEAISQSGKRVALVASGDLSHRLIPGAPAGYDPQGKVFDQAVRDAIAGNDLDQILNLPDELVEHAGECGLRPIIMLAGALQGYQVEPVIHSYQGPFGVGYLVANFNILGQVQDGQRRSCVVRRDLPPFVSLAHDSLEHYLGAKKFLPLPDPLPEGMRGKAGVFVSIKKHGQLRGCIGTIKPTQPNVAAEIIHNAVSAAVSDPRFLPVELDELPELKIWVDVLETPEPVTDEGQLNPREYGVIVRQGNRAGLLLPDLPGVDSVAEQVRIARQKAGIGPDEPVQLWRFRVSRYE